MVRPVKAFDAILNAVVTEFQRAKGAKVTLTLEIEAMAPDGFAEGGYRVGSAITPGSLSSKASPRGRVSRRAGLADM
jgi:hypothetical protein